MSDTTPQPSAEAMAAAEQWLNDTPQYCGGYKDTLARIIDRHFAPLREENTRLRAALALSPNSCAYCQLPASEWNKCANGFPECARADDAIGCPHLGAGLEPTTLRAENAKLRKALEENEWMPIETAPKDGTWFLAYSNGTYRPTRSRVAVIHRVEGVGFGPWEGAEEAYYKPDFFSHWKPLPELPEPPASITPPTKDTP